MGLFLLALCKRITPFKMKKIAWLYTLLLFPFFNHAQYWQQKTDYTIHVRLDDANHFLHGDLSLLYTNNSPQALSEIRFHLWPNAYKSPKTPMNINGSNYGKKLLADYKNQGFMDSIDFKVNGQSVVTTYVDEFKEMAIIKLSSPLLPGKTVQITTPFRVKIPHNGISRLGHYENSYQITQWYPKPAVYDREGWHHMPYLTQGEFYSEFGSFDVSITLPENYVLGASGNLQTVSEAQFMENKIAQAPAIIDSLSKLKSTKFSKDNQLFNPRISSNEQLKTVRYTLDNVHDFAFFAEKGYIVQSGVVKLPHSGREVKLYAMYYPLNYKTWNNSIDYLRDAVYYYSLWNGDYPYDVCTAVDGAIAAGGGMEYPTITVIGNVDDTTDLDLVIAHEVGHNWFYGILGSNERASGWMDEGINSFNEMRYMQLKYPHYNMTEMILPGKYAKKIFINHKESYRLAAQLTQQLSIHQKLSTHSEDFQSLNYGVDMYQRTAISLQYLQKYLGEELFDKTMQTYFERWKFKHPYPSDIRAVFEEVSGKNLAWFFEDMINTRKTVDYRLNTVRKKGDKIKVKVGNPGQIDGPKIVQLIKDNKVAQEIILEPTENVAVFDASTPYDYVTLDHEKLSGDIYLNNNYGKIKSANSSTKSVGFLTSFDLNQHRKAYFLPTLGVNEVDGFQLGFAVHNYAVPMKRFQYLINPMFGFESENLTGLADFNWRFNHLKLTSGSVLGVTLKTYQDFYSFLPYWRVNLNNPAKGTNYDHDLTVQGIIDFQHNWFESFHMGAFVQYEGRKQMGNHELSGKARVAYLLTDGSTTHFSRINGELKYNLNLPKVKNFLEVRLFGAYQPQFGAFGYGNSRYALNYGGNTGNTDIFRENTYYSRGYENTSLRDNNMGAMGIATTDQAQSYLMTTRVSVGIPKVSFIRGYYDFGFGDVFFNPVKSHHVAGLALQYKEYFGVYFPLYSSRHDIYNGNYGDYMSFYVKWNFVRTPIRIKSFFR